MYYELYIDVFFLVNFMMDFCILSISKIILKCPATYGSICAGALLGSVLSCITVALPVTYRFVKFAIFHGLISILMTKTGLRVKWNRDFPKAYAVVYCSAFLIGGIFSSLKQYMRESSLFFMCALLSSYVARKIWDIFSYLGRSRNICCDAVLVEGENQVKVSAIIDTGNRLRDVLTGKPVSIISKETAGRLWQEIPSEGLRYIPYHTIGKRNGILPVLVLERLYLHLEEEVCITKVLVAISEEQIGTGEYEMILNPDIR